MTGMINYDIISLFTAILERLRRWKKHPPRNLQQRLASWLARAGQAKTYLLLNFAGIGP